MSLRFIIFVVLVLLFNYASATVPDSITVSGKVIPDSGTALSSLASSVSLYTYRQPGQAFYTKLSSDGTFSFRLLLEETTLFELKYKGYRLNLMLTPAESVCKVVIHCNERDARNMTTLDSRENEAYNKYLRRTNNAVKEDMKSLKQECVDPKACAVKLKSISTLQNMKMEYIREKYKGTYAASIAKMAEMPVLTGSKSPLADMQEHFFDDGDFTDLKQYLTPDLGEKLTLYLDNLADTTATGRLAFITNLINKAKANREAEKELILLLLNNFMEADREPYLHSLVKWAATRTNLANEQAVVAAKIALLAKVIPGGVAPDVTAVDTGGAEKTLLSTVGGNKLNLLIFWESDCPHCRKAMPEFMRLYQKYHALGLGVFAASSDTDKEKWKQFITTNHLVWENVILPENSSIHSDYFIQYTPTVVLIDKNGRIVRRFIEVADLDANIAEILAK